MKNMKINKFLVLSCVCLIIVCAVVFLAVSVFMEHRTTESLEGVNKVYMSEMNVQLRQKFSSIVGLRLTQVEGVLKRTQPEQQEHGDKLIEELTLSGEVRNFIYMAFLTEDGRLEKIYGDDIDVVDGKEEEIKASLIRDGNILEQGVNKDGEKILLFGKAAAYPMSDGRKSAALVAGISMEVLNDALFLDSVDTLVYTHIINAEGNFVIRNAEAYRESYFERIREEFSDGQAKDAEAYIAELKEAMVQGKDYYMVLNVNGAQRQAYCSPLSENVRWYLITIMPKNTLNNMMLKLDHVRMFAMIFSLSIIVGVMLAIFVRYYGLTKEQMLELDRTKQEAVRANDAKSQFLSSMSHDIRTPMNAIVGMTEIALKNIPNQERIEDCLKKIKLSSKHLLGLINDILDMSKIESGKMTLNMNQVSLRSAIDDIVNIIQPQIREKSLFFDIFIQKIQVEEVVCDSVRLNQVLLNILSNAVKYTPEGGTIHVYLYQESSPLGEGYIRMHFRIKDNGIGMSEEFQEKIFDAFTREDSERTTKVLGTGLGMAITKRIVDLMGGTIEVTSEVGKGTEFRVIVDFKAADVKEEDMKLPDWNILLVDDNELLCSSAAYNLNELGCRTDWTTDSAEAIQMIQEHHLNNEGYRFVLVDWKMPNMDGLQTIRSLREIMGKDDIPIFLISAYDWSDIEDEVKGLDIEGFISKPLFKSTLYTCLSQYVAGTGQADPEAKEAIDFTGKHILLAEDIDINWEIVQEILSAVGMELERAENGKICVEKFEQSEPGFYDAILMDIRMPVMNGYDAAKAIRALERPDKDLPIIAMTADAFSDDVKHALSVGMNAHIAKPLDIKELMHLLTKFIRENEEG